MNTLLDLQQNFKNSLLSNENSVEHYLNDNNSALSYSAIDIYQNAYQQRLIDTLKADYPILEQLIGVDNFEDLAINYIAKYPSTSFTLRFFGHNVSDFLKSDLTYQKQPYLAEMAEFEWCLVNVFDAKDSQIVRVNDMNQFKPEDWPSITVKYHPSLHWVVQQWNIVEVYQAMRLNKKVPDMQFNTVAKHCLIWRKQYASFFRYVDTREWLSMQTLEHSTFSTLCDTLTALDEVDENSALNAATYLKTWLSNELITAVYLND